MLAAHGRDLVRLGWGAVDLFGFHPVLGDPWHGIAFKISGRWVSEVARDFIRYRNDDDDKARTFWRGGAKSDALPFFEVKRKASDV